MIERVRRVFGLTRAIVAFRNPQQQETSMIKKIFVGTVLAAVGTIGAIMAYDAASADRDQRIVRGIRTMARTPWTPVNNVRDRYQRRARRQQEVTSPT